MAPEITPFTVSEEGSKTQEAEYVHDVYDAIAAHFSQTRYKPWPRIVSFLLSIEPGSIGLDSGTGNGKYVPLDQDGKTLMIGLDRSINLLKFAKRAGGKEREAVLGDALGLGWRRGAFDFGISIATIHHLSTPSRRREAIESIMHAINPATGRFLLYVWATDQDKLSKRVVPDESDERVEQKKPVQDVLVPWVHSTSLQPTPHVQTPPSTLPPDATPSNPPAQVFHRYYHLFAPHELRGLVIEAASQLGLEVGSPPSSEPDSTETANEANPRRVQTKGVEIVDEGWDRSNWFVEGKMWCV